MKIFACFAFRFIHWIVTDITTSVMPSTGMESEKIIKLQASAQAVLSEQTRAEAGQEVRVSAQAKLQASAKEVLQVCAKRELQISASAEANQGCQAGLLWRWKFSRIRRLWRIQGMKSYLLHSLL